MQKREILVGKSISKLLSLKHWSREEDNVELGDLKCDKEKIITTSMTFIVSFSFIFFAIGLLECDLCTIYFSNLFIYIF